MKTITYNLNLENYEDYYLKIRKFTSDIIKESKIAIGEIIHDFQKFLFENPPKNLYINENFKKNYNFEEHVFELLFLGVMWKNYIKVAIDLDPFYQDILAKLVDLRNQKNIINLEEKGNIDLKEKIDEIRGLLATKHLLTDNIKNILDINHEYYYNNKNNNNNKNSKYLISNGNHINFDNNFNIENLDLLLNYLKATGDYEESLKHLFLWKQFFSKKNDYEINYYFNSILSFTTWFEKIANEELHDYIGNVYNFRENQLQNHVNNVNIIFCARNKSEYYLNMFGAEIMNRVFRYEFKRRDKIAIILPTCMKLQDNLFNEFNSDTKGINFPCKAIKDNLGFKCLSCNDKCNIGKITEIIKKKGNNKNTNVYIATHNSAILSNIVKKDEEELGIVGVACINNLIEGGWKISSSGIPAQCVILDYVGCRKHWDNKGFSTNFNLTELNRILI
jgi:hypothetical protein